MAQRLRCDGGITVVVTLMRAFRIVSILVTPNIHLNITITYRPDYCRFIVAHVSAPYNIAGLTTVYYTVSFSFTGIILSQNTSLHLFQFLHAALTQCVNSISMTPDTSTLKSTNWVAGLLTVTPCYILLSSVYGSTLPYLRRRLHAIQCHQ